MILNFTKRFVFAENDGDRTPQIANESNYRGKLV